MAIAGKIYRALLRFFEKYYGFFFAAGVLVLAFYCFRWTIWTSGGRSKIISMIPGIRYSIH